MKFLADECCDAGLVAALRSDGHDVLYAMESARGTTDDVLLQCAYDEDRILLTEDKHFGELVYRLRKPARSVVLLRFGIEERHLKIPRIRMLIREKSEGLFGSFFVLDAVRARFRAL